MQRHTTDSKKAKAEAVKTLQAQLEAAKDELQSTKAELEERITLLEHDVRKYQSESRTLRERAEQAESVIETIKQRRRDTTRVSSAYSASDPQRTVAERKDLEEQLLTRSTELSMLQRRLEDALRKRHEAEKARDALLERSSSLNKSPNGSVLDSTAVNQRPQGLHERRTQSQDATSSTANRAFPPSSFNAKSTKDRLAKDYQSKLKQVTEQRAALETDLAAKFSEELAAAKRELLAQFREVAGTSKNRDMRQLYDDAANRSELELTKTETRLREQRELRFAADMRNVRQTSYEFQSIVNLYEDRIAQILGTEGKMGSDLSIGPEQFEHMAEENYRRSFETTPSSAPATRRTNSSYAALSNHTPKSSHDQAEKGGAREPQNTYSTFPQPPVGPGNTSPTLRDAYNSKKSRPFLRLRKSSRDRQAERQGGQGSDQSAKKSSRKSRRASPHTADAKINGNGVNGVNKQYRPGLSSTTGRVRSLAERQSSAMSSPQVLTRNNQG